MNKFIKIIMFLSLGLTIAFTTSYAQGRTGLVDSYNKAKDLYENELYAAADKQFDKTLNLLSINSETEFHINRAEISAYKVLCAIKMRRNNIDELVAKYEYQYPEAVELAQVKFYQASYYFDKENYAKCLSIINEIQNQRLPRKEMLDYLFYRAYCNMRVGNYPQAIAGFNKIRSIVLNKYTTESKYYLAYVYYLNKDFKNAITLFEELKNLSQYSLYSKYFLLESHFMLKDNAYVLENGEKLFSELDGSYKMKLARILSEAYFSVNNSRKAKDYFDIYSSSGANLSRKDNYYSGVVSYSLKAYLSSINAFEKVVGPRDSLTQNSYYHLGNCYLKAKNKHQALIDFKKASMYDFDKKIKEDSYFNYAKLAFDINSDISGFNNYLQMFSKDANSDEIYYYIATAYLMQKKYQKALDMMTKITYPSSQVSNNIQKASFFRGMEYFQMKAYSNAISNFERAEIKYPNYNARVADLSKFWRAEAYYRTGNYQECININKQLISSTYFHSTAEYPVVFYNIAYAYFKNKDYVNAIESFNKYLSYPPSKREMTSEAKLRLADSYFMTSDYERSAELYETIYKLNYDDTNIYAAYQSAIAYGLQSRQDKKIEMLREIVEQHPNSSYINQAMYELGRTYVQQGMPDKAEIFYNKLLTTKNQFHNKVLLELGMIANNKGFYDTAVKYYKQILTNSPYSEEAKDALSGMESIYQQQNKAEEFLAYIDKIGMSSAKTAGEKETMLFNSAEQIFLDGNMQKAIVSLKRFISKYPESSKVIQSDFYIAEAYHKIDKPEEAAAYYLKVMQNGEGSFREISTLSYAKICYSLQDYQKAISAYESLQSIATLENNKFDALVGLMRSYYKNGDNEKAIMTGEKVLSTERGQRQLSIEANYIVAKSLLVRGERQRAITILKKLASSSATAEGAEANYLLIQDAYDSGKFEDVENLVYAFSDSNTPQTYWLANSFILLGDSFAERELWKQAEATFESIKDGYKPRNAKDNVLELVEMRLKKIKDNMAMIKDTTGVSSTMVQDSIAINNK